MVTAGIPKPIACKNKLALGCKLSGTPNTCKKNGISCKMSIANTPRITATHNDWRTITGICSVFLAPFASATNGVVAIIMPLNKSMTGIHKPTPTAIAAKSAADKCPAIMVSINPNPA
ncbi:Uncharacterised protein [Acinetobacter baumannii]|nr:Uncharacterised protein [Acinetobacter baumannii]